MSTQCSVIYRIRHRGRLGQMLASWKGLLTATVVILWDSCSKTLGEHPKQFSNKQRFCPKFRNQREASYSEVWQTLRLKNDIPLTSAARSIAVRMGWKVHKDWHEKGYIHWWDDSNSRRAWWMGERLGRKRPRASLSFQTPTGRRWHNDLGGDSWKWTNMTFSCTLWSKDYFCVILPASWVEFPPLVGRRAPTEAQNVRISAR